MRILIIKTSSLGDIIHAFPALTDLQRSLPQAEAETETETDTEVEWVAEEAFAELPSWHGVVKKTHQVAWRRWRKHPLGVQTFWREWRALRQELFSRHYDCVIDAQYLLKSAIIGRGLSSSFHGLAKGRDPLASYFYTHHHSIAKGIHAVEKIRRLFSLSLGYPTDKLECDFGLSKFQRAITKDIFLLPNTSKARKTLAIELWQELACLLVKDGYRCILPGHTAEEAKVANEIASVAPDDCSVLPRCSLTSIASRIAKAAGVVSVDTGLAHLATALGVPTVCLFTVSNPYLFGCYGKNAVNLFAEQGKQESPHPYLAIRHTELEAKRIYATLDEKISSSGP